MSDPFEGRPFPRVVLIGAAAMIAFAILAAAMVRLTGIGATSYPLAPVIEARELVFKDQGNGKTLVFIPGSAEDHRDDALVAELDSGTDGFVLGVLRATNRNRKLRNVPFDAPYLLAVREDNRLVFIDPATDGEIDVRAFGPTNWGSFATLLRAEPKPMSAASPAAMAPAGPKPAVQY